MSISALERRKYEKAWAVDAYHSGSPGASYIDMFMKVAQPQPGASIIDVGAGAGEGSRALADKGFRVMAFDLTSKAWAQDDIDLHTGCIWRDLGIYANPPFDFAYCCDVMEHIPTQFVGSAISAILNSCGRAFFSISFTPDIMGAAIGETLHLTVKPFTWWRDTFRELGTLYDARDLIGDGVFYAGR